MKHGVFDRRDFEKNEKTIHDVIDSMSEEQKNVMYALIGEARETPERRSFFTEEEWKKATNPCLDNGLWPKFNPYIKQSDLQVGDHIIVINSGSYPNSIAYSEGIVEKIYKFNDGDKYAVRVNKYYHPENKNGWYYFDRSSIKMDYTYYAKERNKNMMVRSLEIDRVIFNDPATIIYWKDKTKTVVKCGENDIYDAEKGMAMAIAKRVLGDKGAYYNEFKKWLPEPVAEENPDDSNRKFIERLKETLESIDEKMSFGFYESYCKTTAKEYVAEHYPDNIDEVNFGGGVSGCPVAYFKSENSNSEIDKLCSVENKPFSIEMCARCWNRILPPDTVDKKTGKHVYPNYIGK